MPLFPVRGRNSRSEYLPGPLHVVANLHAKGAVGLTSAAHQAVVRSCRERMVMLRHRFRHSVLLGGQIEEFGHRRNVDVGGAGLAVIAVHAASGHLNGIPGAENMGISPYIFKKLELLIPELAFLKEFDFDEYLKIELRSKPVTARTPVCEVINSGLDDEIFLDMIVAGKQYCIAPL